jgi:thymidine kinase
MNDQIYYPTIGAIELITGPMFSGKTGELIRRVSRAHIARLNTKLFKPNIDTRYAVDSVVSHDKKKLEAINVESPLEILGLSVDADVIGIDEIQFFGEDLIDVCTKLANGGKRVIVAGLDRNHQGEPFSPLPSMMCVADYVTKLQAVCMRCGAPATFTLRKIKNQKQEIMLGERFDYEALCRACYHKEKIR